MAGKTAKLSIFNKNGLLVTRVTNNNLAEFDMVVNSNYFNDERIFHSLF